MTLAYPEEDAARTAMVASQLRTSGVSSPALLMAMGRIAREAFVPEDRRATAYIDRAIPLGSGRALNPPATIAQLIEAADVASGDRVLVVGAGSGYTLAVVAALGAVVFGVESDPRLTLLANANVPDAEVVEGPLEAGAAGNAAYDAIIIDGAVESVPEALIGQLASDGRLVTGLVENGVTRLARGRRGGTGFGLVAFADAEAAPLPGFARPRTFVF